MRGRQQGLSSTPSTGFTLSTKGTEQQTARAAGVSHEGAKPRRGRHVKAIRSGFRTSVDKVSERPFCSTDQPTEVAL